MSVPGSQFHFRPDPDPRNKTADPKHWNKELCEEFTLKKETILFIFLNFTKREGGFVFRIQEFSFKRTYISLSEQEKYMNLDSDRILKKGSRFHKKSLDAYH